MNSRTLAYQLICWSLFFTVVAGQEPTGPYPVSPVILDLTLDWSTHRRAAQGSDNFQLTWADDDHQYGWWGDGGGFGGSNRVGRVGLGFARIEGNSRNWQGVNGRDRYTWFTGMSDKKPNWGSLDQKQPVFENPSGTGWCLSASYNSGLDRYLLCTEHGNSHAGMIGIFDAPEPWGTWTTVKYWTSREPFGDSRRDSDLDWKPNVFFVAFPPRWVGDNGKFFTVNFTGGGQGKDNDSFNTVEGRFTAN